MVDNIAHSLFIDATGVKIEGWDYTILIPQPLEEGQVPSYQPGTVVKNETGETIFSFSDAAAFIDSAKLLEAALVTRYGGYK